MTFMERLRRVRSGDSGAALMTVLMAGAILTASALVMVNLSLTNLRNAGRDRVAGGAMGAAEAGLSEGVNFLQTHPPARCPARRPVHRTRGGTARTRPP